MIEVDLEPFYNRNMRMPQRHIITALDKDHELIEPELSNSSYKAKLHKIELSERELSDVYKTAFAVRHQIVNLPLRVGDEVVVVTEDDQAVIEMLSVCFLQRRFNECIKLSVKRRSGEFFIPYLTNLKPGQDDEREGMVRYNYHSGSCSGNCSDCG